MDFGRPRTRKLVLCFDGTGNKFSGDENDSNILKIFRMLDRTACDQYHYYQPGIGTYIVGTSLSHTGVPERIKQWWLKTKDSAIGSSFDQHVVGGYRFLMRYYNPGDEIYIFGFSRGAYIARFLAEMLDYVGLLSHGNEEMVDFAWNAFAQWQCRRASITPHGVRKQQQMYGFLKGFRETFSRPVRRIRFLGLFDTVNSVPRFETAWMQRSKFPYTARTSAKVIRHAVSIDERRAKFRQDLMYQRMHVGKDKHKHILHRQPSPSHSEDDRYRHRGSVATIKPLIDQIEARGRRQTLAVPEDPEPYRAHSTRSHSRATNTSSVAPDVRHSLDGLSDMSGNHVPGHGHDDFSDEDETEQDIDEVWFAGGHGDVGGGWEVAPGVKSASHVPLAWMVREAMKAGLSFDIERVRDMSCMDAFESYADTQPSSQPAGQGQGEMPPTPPWPPQTQPPETQQGPIPDIFVRTPSSNVRNKYQTPRFNMSHESAESAESSIVRLPEPGAPSSNRTAGPLSAFHEMMHAAHLARIHDSLRYDCGMSFLSVLTWRLMEYLPFRRMDLQADGSWKPIRWPLPCGEVRDVPDNVRVHGSVIRRMRGDAKYRPGNLIVGGGGRGVLVAPPSYGIGDWVCVAEEGDPIGEIWMKRGHAESLTSVR